MKKAILSKILQEGLAVLGISVSETVQAQLVDYVLLLQQWNAVHNLTAVRDPEEMIKKHVLDSLSLVAPLKAANTRILDVGTGAGLPGIPLALCLPEQSIVMLDSTQKKINFVQHVILSLKLKNATAICTRVESYHPACCFDWVVSRAFASLADFVRLTAHLCCNGGHLVAMKGKLSEAERTEFDLAAKEHQTIDKIQSVTVPGIEGERVLVFIAIQTEA